MSINKFGLSDNVTKSSVNKKYVDSQFITLVKRLEAKANKSGDNFSGPINMANNKVVSSFEPDTPDTVVNKLYVDTSLIKIGETKLNKSGDVMTGILDMTDHIIRNVADPIEDNDSVNRGYIVDYVTHVGNSLKTDILSDVQRDSALLKNELNQNFVRTAGDTMKGDLDMGGHSIKNANDPEHSKYLQIAYQNNSDNINVRKLLSICRILNDYLAKHSNDFASAFDRQFRLKYTWLENLMLTYIRLYSKKPEVTTSGYVEPRKLEIQPAVEEILFTRIKDILYLYIMIIEELPHNIFIDLKESLVQNKLIMSPQEGTDLMKIRRFIQKFANDVDPNRESENMELLVHKNIMFVDLGIKYVSNSLLNQFVI